jgi:4-amino-4-deoxy-L-arabinose transferase-like glycosyltransferase
MWNTKPPLLIWIMAFLMKILGPTELAIRLTSVISATLTVFLLFFFGKKYFKDTHIGLASSLVLIASMGYAESHIATSGDYDALLVLWLTTASLLYFTYVQDIDKNKKLIYPIVIAITLAVLTKGIAGLLFLPGLFLYTLWTGNVKKILFSKDLYKALTIFVVVISTYYLGREFFNPGYISAVIENEVTGRFLNIVDSEPYSYWFYLEKLLEFRYIPWIYVLPLSIILTLFSKKKLIKQFSIFAIFYLITFFLIISESETKQLWYDAPLYPIMAIIIGASLVEFFQRVMEKVNLSIFAKKIALTIFILAVVYIPLVDVYKYIHRSDYSNLAPIIDYGKFLNDFLTKYPTSKEVYYISYNHNAQVYFYVKVANQNGSNVQLRSSIDDFIAAEIVLTCDKDEKSDIEKKYITGIMYSNKDCKAYKII